MLYPILEQYDVDIKKALAYGFVREGAGLILRKVLPETEFYAVVTLAGKALSVNVLERDTDEEYLPFNVADNISGYVMSVREKAEALLEEIKTQCLIKSNVKLQLMDYCSQRFGTVPEAPWPETPENFTFKTARRNKWYALFMTIPYKSLGLAKAGKVDVLNIKLPPAKIEQLVDMQHFYPAYHMNKKHWLTVMLQKDADIPLVQELLAEACGVTAEQIVDTELFLYNRMPATTVGLEQEYVAGGRLDDLQCVFAGLQGFLAAEAGESVPVFCMLDNEEVGSGTKQGAAATFLKDALQRINMALGRDEEDYLVSLANSLMLSADNAHAVHPNHTDKNDLTNKTYPNEGVVVKYSANQKYTTDAVSGALVQLLAKKANVPLQLFYNRSDMAGGSTLGNISTSQVAIKSVDIGLAQLAMHSAYEMAGVKDTAYLAELAQAFFAAAVAEAADGTYFLK